MAQQPRQAWFDASAIVLAVLLTAGIVLFGWPRIDLPVEAANSSLSGFVVVTDQNRGLAISEMHGRPTSPNSNAPVKINFRYWSSARVLPSLVFFGTDLDKTARCGGKHVRSKRLEYSQLNAEARKGVLAHLEYEPRGRFKAAIDEAIRPSSSARQIAEQLDYVVIMPGEQSWMPEENTTFYPHNNYSSAAYDDGESYPGDRYYLASRIEFMCELPGGLFWQVTGTSRSFVLPSVFLATDITGHGAALEAYRDFTINRDKRFRLERLSEFAIYPNSKHMQYQDGFTDWDMENRATGFYDRRSTIAVDRAWVSFEDTQASSQRETALIWVGLAASVVTAVVLEGLRRAAGPVEYLIRGTLALLARLRSRAQTSNASGEGDTS